jgi:hypothetical protein
MAFKTFTFVLLDTRVVQLTTRETVAVETPATLATSLTLGANWPKGAASFFDLV